MTKTERRQLHRDMHNGSRIARGTLWSEAMRLVYRTESRLRSLYGQEALDEDMIQEGAVAAGRAVDTWDPTRSSFATWVLSNVRGAMLDYANEAGKAGIASKSTDVSLLDMEEGVAFSPETSGTEDRPGFAADGSIPRSELLTYEGVQLGAEVDGAGYVPEEYQSPEHRTEIERLRRVLRELPTDDAYLLQAFYGIDRAKRTAEEIATDLGFSVSGIRKRVTILQSQVRFLLTSR